VRRETRPLASFYLVSDGSCCFSELNPDGSVSTVTRLSAGRPGFDFRQRPGVLLPAPTYGGSMAQARVYGQRRASVIRRS
jgi:hypothetical protein